MNILILNPPFALLICSQPAEKNRAKPKKQKGKKEGGLGEGIFALLRTPRRRRGCGESKERPGVEKR